MSRNRFLGTTADVAILVNNSTLNITANPTATFTFWSAATSGTQYTDLKELDGTTTVVAYHPNADGSMRAIYGPDAVTQMWADGAGSERFLVQCWVADSAGNASVMTPTALKSVSYTGVAQDFITWDLTSANGTLNLPASFTLTINRGGTDHFKTATGPTSLTMNELEHTIVLQYKSSTKVWYVGSGAGRTSAGTAINAAAYAPSASTTSTSRSGTTDVVISNGLPFDELYHPALSPTPTR
jgi:hypothetical protein